jgi:acyl-CoA carboxylase subunit beta
MALTASGGTRIQEGAMGFIHMAPIAAAVNEHQQAGFAFFTYLRHPSMGGMHATLGSLGQVTIAEPHALIGFVGPRVHSALGASMRSDTQRAEHLAVHGIIDAVMDQASARDHVAKILHLLRTPPNALDPRSGDPSEPTRDAATPWERIINSRRPARPDVDQLLAWGCSDHVILAACDDVLIALASFAGTTAVVIGQRRLNGQSQALTIRGLQLARRGITLAQQWHLPLVTVIDTVGAEISDEAEEQGIAAHLASMLVEMTATSSPSISFILGMGAGGGAIAFLPANRVLCSANAWLAPLPPEALAAFGSSPQGDLPPIPGPCASWDLFDAGIVDVIVGEHPDAADEPHEFCARAAAAIARELTSFAAAPDVEWRSAGRVRLLTGEA